MANQAPFLLYSDYRSSCAARVRLALILKRIPFDTVAVDIHRSAQHGAAYTRLNPSASVPTLVDRNQRDFAVGQSVAALEYLEDVFPRHLPLLPPPADPMARATVRTLVEIIVADTQPLTNTRVLPKVRAGGVDGLEWSKGWFLRGLAAYEAVAKTTAGRYSVGSKITLADVCLVPAVWNCEKADIGLDDFPTVKRVYETLSKDPAVEQGHWKRQPDCPEEERDPNYKATYGK